jgi:xylulokinase
MSYFVGIDISTTGTKALAMDERGALLSSKTFEYNLSTPRPLWAEQNPEDWWTATCNAIRDLLTHIPADAIKAIGLTGQMLGLTALDAHDQPLRPAILWNDGRSHAECLDVTMQIGDNALYQHIGTALLPGMTVPKLLWMRTHEPDLYRQIARVVLPKDYVRLKLCGESITDVADGSGFGLMDVGARKWSDRVIDALDIPRAWLPSLCESPEVSAVVSAAGALATGLLPNTPIVGGAGDQSAQALGSGIVPAGAMSVTVGTSGVVFVSADRYAPDEQGRLHTFCHALPGCWCSMGVMQSAAGSLRWLHDELLPNHSYEDVSALAETVSCGAQGLLFAPYLSGERHPYSDPLARGAFVGLTVRHRMADMVRATMEGVGFAMRDLVELSRMKGIMPTSAAISGGAANSSVWRQIMTDIMNMPLYTVNTTAGAALGAAILAGVGVGAWADVPTACSMLIHQIDATQPHEDEVAAYDVLYQAYRQLYPTLRATFAALAEFEAR